MPKKKTTKKTAKKTATRRRKPVDADTFLDTNDCKRIYDQGWRIEQNPEIQAIVDRANERRLEGEALALKKIATALKREYDIPLASKTITLRVLEYVGRSTW